MKFGIIQIPCNDSLTFIILRYFIVHILVKPHEGIKWTTLERPIERFVKRTNVCTNTNSGEKIRGCVNGA